MEPVNQLAHAINEAVDVIRNQSDLLQIYAIEDPDFPSKSKKFFEPAFQKIQNSLTTHPFRQEIKRLQEKSPNWFVYLIWHLLYVK